MTIIYLFILHLIITTLFVYGQDILNADECIPVYKLLGKEQSNNCCSEEGIICKNGHIIGIDLSENELNSSIPPEIVNLSQLQYLYLDHNHLSGSIPPEFGNLNQLTELVLFDNELSGSIPSELVNLSQLEYLSLSFNNFTGQIPKEIGKLTKLQILNLEHNNLDGSILTELGNLNQLTKLTLSFNNFTGSIPKELGNLSQLTRLDLGYNHLNGPIPKELENLKQLTELDLISNDFCGSLPKLPNNCEIDYFSNERIGKKCSDEEIQQNNNINDEKSKNIGTGDKTNNNNNGNSQKLLLIIVGVCSLLLILIILAYFKIKNNNKKDNDNSHVSEQELLNYAFKEKKYFEWKIENWNQLKDKEYSSAFKANEHLWKLMLIPNSFNEDNKESIDVGLLLCDKIDKNELIYANYIVYFRNYNDNEVYKKVNYDDKPILYNAKTLNHKINDAILKSELYDITDDGCSLLENNKIIIGILIKFYLPNPIIITNGN